MNPEEKNALFLDAVLGELSSTQREQLDALLAADASSRAEFEELRSLWSDLGAVLEVPAGQDESLLASPFTAAVDPLPQHRSTPSRRWWGIALAAGIALFVLGAWFGTSWRSSESSGGSATESSRSRSAAESAVGLQQPRFAVLLYSKPSSAAPDPEFVRQVVDEMKAWRDDLAIEQRHILAEKLSGHADVELETIDGSIQQRSTLIEATAPRLGGLYIISANDLEEATAIARQCPLLRYGGVVRVRSIDDV